MNSIFRTLNQLYYLIYTLVILLTISCYFLNLNNLIFVQLSILTANVLLGLYAVVSVMAIGYFIYFLIIKGRLTNFKTVNERNKHYLKSARILLILIGVSLIFGIICFYLIRSFTVLYPLAISAVMLLLSKPNQSKIDDILTEN